MSFIRCGERDWIKISHLKPDPQEVWKPEEHQAGPKCQSGGAGTVDQRGSRESNHQNCTAEINSQLPVSRVREGQPDRD